MNSNSNNNNNNSNNDDDDSSAAASAEHTSLKQEGRGAPTMGQEEQLRLLHLGKKAKSGELDLYSSWQARKQALRLHSAQVLGLEDAQRPSDESRQGDGAVGEGGGLSVAASDALAMTIGVEHKPAFAGICGMRNLRHTCFVNCVLQCLLHSREFVNAFRATPLDDLVSPWIGKTNKYRRVIAEFVDICERVSPLASVCVSVCLCVCVSVSVSVCLTVALNTNQH